MRIAFVLLCLLSVGGLSAQQDCYLGVGGPDDQTITEVFRLDSLQQEQLANLGAELKFRNQLLTQRAEYLLELHAQSSPEDLLVMSFEYRQVLDSMHSNMRLIDKKLLSLFNDQQYNLYIRLCNQAQSSPIYAPRATARQKKKKDSR